MSKDTTMTRHYYGVFNSHADTRRHSRGFSNTWSVVRFKDKAERNEFLDAYEHKLARAVSRGDAEGYWQSNYTTVGDNVPTGGLFGQSWSGPRFDEWAALKECDRLAIGVEEDAKDMQAAIDRMERRFAADIEAQRLADVQEQSEADAFERTIKEYALAA